MSNFPSAFQKQFCFKMDDQIDILGTLSSPYKTKSISFLKATGRTNMKFDNNNAIINLNSPSRQARSADFNKENEFVNNSQKKKHSVEPVDTILSFEDDEECDVLDCDELIDLESLIPSGKKLWLIDTQSTLDDSFNLETWLNQPVTEDDSGSSYCGGSSSIGGARNRIWSSGRSGLCKPSPISNNNRNNNNNNNGGINCTRSPSLNACQSLQTNELSNSSVAASQLETLRRKSKVLLNNSSIVDSPCNNSNTLIPATNSLSTNNLDTTITVSSPSLKIKPPSMLNFGESKSRFGLRVPSQSSESETGENQNDVSHDEPSNLNLTFDITDMATDAVTASGIACASPFLNKSFDDVLSVATSSPYAAMQKSMSKSQESCFFSSNQISVAGIDRGLGSMGSGSIRGSTNRITNVEDVQNIARLQADHLRQTLRTGGFSNKRLSQSTDRLRHTSNNNLTDQQEQFTRMPMVSDSDDNLVSKSKAPPLSLTQNLPDSSAPISHPKSLPNIIPRTKMLYQAPKKLQQLNTSGGGSQPLVAKELPKSSLKMTTSCLPNGVVRPPLTSSSTKLRNPSLNRGQQNPSIPTKQGVSPSPSPVVVQTGLRAPSKLPASKQVSRLQPPQSGGKFRGEKLSDSDRSSEGDGFHDANSSGKSNGSGRLQLSSEVNKVEVKVSAGVASSTSQTSLPIPKGIPRLSSIPRSRLKPPTKSFAASNF